MGTDDPSDGASKNQNHLDDEGNPPITSSHRLECIRDSANVVLKGSNEVVNQLRGLLDIAGRVERHPYVMMAAAVSSGYVMSGGPFSPLTARGLDLGLRLSMRMAAIPFIQRELLGFAEAAMERGDSPESPFYGT